MTQLIPVPVFEMAVVTGLTEGAKLRDCRRVSYSPTQAIFDDNMSQEQWTEYGRGLRMFHQAYRYYQADWLNFGKKKFGALVVEGTVIQLGFDLGDIEVSLQVALLPAESRLAELTSTHHEIIGFLIDTEKLPVADAPRWLMLAREEGLTPGELHNSIIAGHVVKRSRGDEGGHSNRDGFLSIHGINTTFTRWLKNVEKNGSPVDKMAIEQKREILTELKPIADLYAKLQSEVSA